MDAAACVSSQIPDHPRVRRAEEQVPGFGICARAGNVLEDPRDLRRGEIGRQREPGLQGEPIGAAVLGQSVDELLGAGVLPDERVRDGSPGAAVPHDGRLTLIGDAEAGDVSRREPGRIQRGRDHPLRVRPDLDRVVLDPAGPREDLIVLALRGRHDRPIGVEHDCPRRRRPLIERQHVGGRRPPGRSKPTGHGGLIGHSGIRHGSPSRLPPHARLRIRLSRD